MQRAVSSVLARIRHRIARESILLAGDRALVAVSGGSDSMALLVALHRLRASLAVDLAAAHVHHGLRGADADADARLVRETCDGLAIPLRVHRLGRGALAGGNMEERARGARYAALRTIAEEEGCRRVLTAHTRDDQAETVLLRLLRGSGVHGMRGIRAVRDDGVARPLLDCSRAELQRMLDTLDVPYRTDASNHDLRQPRAWVRAQVLPLLREADPQVDRHLKALAEQAETVATITDEWAAAILREIAPDGGIALRALTAQPDPRRSLLVRAWLSRSGLFARDVPARHVEGVLRLASGRRGSGSWPLPGGWVVRKTYDRLSIGRTEEAAVPIPIEMTPGSEVVWGAWRLGADRPCPRHRVAWPPDLWSALCDADSGPLPFRIRPPRHGDRVHLPSPGERRLSDVFIDRRVPAPERGRHPVVEAAGEVIWVPGCARSRGLRVADHTRQVVRLWARPHNAARESGAI